MGNSLVRLKQHVFNCARCILDVEKILKTEKEMEITHETKKE